MINLRTNVHTNQFWSSLGSGSSEQALVTKCRYVLGSERHNFTRSNTAPTKINSISVSVTLSHILHREAVWEKYFIATDLTAFLLV